jgi:hypothetical protein
MNIRPKDSSSFGKGVFKALFQPLQREHRLVFGPDQGVGPITTYAGCSGA